MALAAVTLQHTAILDGAEWASVQRYLLSLQPQSTTGSSKAKEEGCLEIVVGTLPKGNKRVVGVQIVDTETTTPAEEETVTLSDTCRLYKDSVAAIPDSVSDAQAISTYTCSTAWHAAFHQAATESGIGGSDISETITAVVVGGSQYAIVTAAALQALGATVTIVSTGSPAVAAGVQTLKPATGDLQVGFCNAVGTFDILVDTVGNERDDADTDFTDSGIRSAVLRYLLQRHQCRSYISTVTQAQTILAKQGVLFGPKQANQHLQQQLSASHSFVVPPANLGRTVETLLQAGITVSAAKAVGNTYKRGWSLPAYWELVTWPRDSAGGANVRYGFPVPEDLDSLNANDAEEMVAEPPLRSVARTMEEEMAPSETPEESNPYILNIVGVRGLQETIVDSEADCLLFLSAPFCRTCRYLQPQYQRLARLGTQEHNGAVTFAKAEAVGATGKELGRLLEVEAVPAFLLFRKGKLFGEPLSITRLPSPKLQLAIQYLITGKPWDEQAIRDVERKAKDSKR
jgi:hypothetical protein